MLELKDPTPLVNQVYWRCGERAATVDEETMRTKSEMFQMSTTSNVEEIYKKKKTIHSTQKVSSWSYDVKGHAEQFTSNDTVIWQIRC